jgi:putative DNA primase/helicase
MSEIADRCRNHWTPILAALSVLDEKALRHRDVPCPVCGGRDRFRYTDKGYGRWFCRGCGRGGDGLALVMHVRGIDFVQATTLIESVLGSSSSTWGASSNDKPRDLLKPWREATPLTRSSAAWRYFENRGLALTDAETVPLRYRDAAWHWPTGSTWPSVVALVRHHDGTELCAHQTFIKPNGSDKAPVEKPRLFPKGGKTDGGGVWFGTPDPEREFLVGEGIESTLSAMRLYRAVSGCAALSDGGISRLLLPHDVRRVRIFADHDELGQGLAAAVAARLRWRSEGRQVAISHAKNVGEDANDLWRRRVEGRAHV